MKDTGKSTHCRMEKKPSNNQIGSERINECALLKLIVLYVECENSETFIHKCVDLERKRAKTNGVNEQSHIPLKVVPKQRSVCVCACP